MVRSKSTCSTNETRLNAGVFFLREKLPDTDRFKEFEQTFSNQALAESELPSDSHSACADTDATGMYVWRKDGAKHGECFHKIFTDAQKLKDNSECDVIPGYVPYAYDAAIALAYGLDKLVEEGVQASKMTAKRLFKAIQEKSFAGVTGNVSFKKNGDRHTADMDYIVYNYQSSCFEDVGSIKKNGNFEPCKGEGCPEMRFSDGSSDRPVVKIVRNDFLPCLVFVSRSNTCNLLDILNGSYSFCLPKFTPFYHCLRIHPKAYLESSYQFWSPS